MVKTAGYCRNAVSWQAYRKPILHSKSLVLYSKRKLFECYVSEAEACDFVLYKRTFLFLHKANSDKQC